MSSTIVFIGGQSQSTKSTVGKNLAEKLGFAYAQLDHCKAKGEKLNIGQHSARGIQFETLQAMASDVIGACQEDTVIEGGWIIPEEIEALTARVKANGNLLVPSFFGYPKATVKSRKAFLKGKSNNHHKRGWRPSKTLQSWIEFSKQQHASCERLGIPYFDFSQTEQLDSLQQAALTDIASRVHPQIL